MAWDPLIVALVGLLAAPYDTAYITWREHNPLARRVEFLRGSLAGCATCHRLTVDPGHTLIYRYISATS